MVIYILCSREVVLRVEDTVERLQIKEEARLQHVNWEVIPAEKIFQKLRFLPIVVIEEHALPYVYHAFRFSKVSCFPPGRSQFIPINHQNISFCLWGSAWSDSSSIICGSLGKLCTFLETSRSNHYNMLMSQSSFSVIYVFIH